jgi:hypothetical protein
MINDHLLIEEACGEYSSDCRKLEKIVAIIQQVVSIDFFIWGVTYLLKNQSYMYKIDE